MKLKFKRQDFQLRAVESVVDVFKGQPKFRPQSYQLDPGRSEAASLNIELNAYRNHPIELTGEHILSNIQEIQRKNGLAPSKSLEGHYNITVEMETGTGKTYTYIRTIMELNKRYGWTKFIIIVPSIAIREGTLKAFRMTAEHFLTEYNKQPRFFVYDSKRLGDIDTFANSSDIQVMIINSQAFNARGKDARRIYMEQESFRWRKPIDVIASMNPILIIDEPQSVEGKKTKERMKEFHPLFTLRYSATHKETYNMVYRLDAMDAYNRQLVKKIAVKSIETVNHLGTDGYLYLHEIIPGKNRGAVKARIEFEKQQASGHIKRVIKNVEEGFNLYEESNELQSYKGMVLHDFNAYDQSLMVGPNQTLFSGEVIGEKNESDIRRLQIRETIQTHLEREAVLFNRGIKVLSLFFIDEVAKYKKYDENNNPQNGDYADVFEEEYQQLVTEYIEKYRDTPYGQYLEAHKNASDVHAGYFAQDKVKKTSKTKFVDTSGTTAKDTDAFDLIMKDKERLLSFDEPVQFIFSHSALKEGWDNPNVFQICTLKDSTSETEKRQKIGRGMRLAVDQNGIRQDKELLGTEVHDINKLTVIANESYKNFTENLQKEMKSVLKDRPQKVKADLFMGQQLQSNDGQTVLEITSDVASDIYETLISSGYVKKGLIQDKYYEDSENNQLELDEFQDYENDIVELLETVYTDKSYVIENANAATSTLGQEVNRDNLAKKEFLELWNKINKKSTYTVSFDDEELIQHAIEAINTSLYIGKQSYRVTAGEANTVDEEGYGLNAVSSSTEVIERSVDNVSYDLIGEIEERTNLTRQTIANILIGISSDKFDLYKVNPEEFIAEASKIINEEKATQVIEHIEYNILSDSYDQSIFTDNPEVIKFNDDEHTLLSYKGIYNYTKVDSKVEKQFQQNLEDHDEVKVYVKLPSAFKISTPVGNYNPDWAIAFKEGSVKHIYFIAETKGSMSSMQLKGAEKTKIECARRLFKKMSQQDHIYDVVDNYETLLKIVSN